MPATSPLLNLKPRTEEQALMDLEQRARERDRFYTNDQRIEALQSALHYLAEAHKWLVFAHSALAGGDGVSDEIAGSNDLQSDIRGKITWLERRR